MSEKPDNNTTETNSDLMMDTQWLLKMEPAAEGSFDLEDILAEFGADSAPPSPAGSDAPPSEQSPPAEAVPEAMPPDTAAVPDAASQETEVPETPPPEPETPPPRWKWWAKKKPAPAPPPPAEGPAAAEQEQAAEAPSEPETPETPEETPPEAAAESAETPDELDEELLAEILPDETAEAPQEAEEAPETPAVPEENAETSEAPQTAEEKTVQIKSEPDNQEASEEQESPEGPEGPDRPEEACSPPDAEASPADESQLIQPISMEAIESLMANTVDAVKEEQEQKQERLRKRLEKARKAVKGSFLHKEPSAKHPLPEIENEPAPSEQVLWNKRRFREVKKSLRLAALATLLLWLPWGLAQFDIAVPFFSDSSDNAALCVLIPQALVSIASWPVFRAALEYLRDGAWSIYATAALCTLVTLLDEMTLMLLPKRVDAAPLGGLAAILLVFALWGLSGLHRGVGESMRTAAMGEPTQVVDRCGMAAAKGAGSRRGFYTRVAMEDTSAQWQRLLLPVLAAASLIFAVLSSVGKGEPQNLLWCWSVILCAASSAVFPLTYCVPFGRLAARLARSGAAVAGEYGASSLASVKKLAVTDEDLFPPHTTMISDLKLYGEDRNRAIAYTASLAVQSGGTLGRVFGNICQNERISFMGVEHFHIHDDGGLSGIIHGETVLVGTPVFMRHKAVRLPGNLPSKTCVCLAVDGKLTAMFVLKYIVNDVVEYALRTARRNSLQILLAVRDGNITPKMIKEWFNTGGSGVLYPDLGERLTLSDPEREADGPSGMMYREGLLPLVSLMIGSERLCQTAMTGNFLSILSSIAGALLGFYFTFTESYEVLTPPLLLTYMLLWVVPMLPQVWMVDKL